MPRESEDAKVIAGISPGPNVGPVEPPRWLEADAQVIWRETIRDVPLGHLRAADYQLLPTFCRLIAYERKLWVIAAAQRAAGQVDPALMKEIRETTGAALAAATKMRLVASSNSRIETGTNRRTLNRNSRPWLSGDGA